MKLSRHNRFMVLALLAGAATLAAPDLLHAQQAYGGYQQVTPGYTYQDVQVPGSNPLLFGVAAYKICQIKSFLFAGVYVLSAIAFVIFAVRALFTKFELKHFLPILGAIFVVATADLFIFWMSEDAFFCPTTFATLAGS